MDTALQKREIRKRIKELKKEHSLEWCKCASEEITAKILSMPQVKSAGTILLYYSLPDEVLTESLIQSLSSSCSGTKRVILPVVSGEDLILKEYHPDKISEGYQNIPEPSSEETVDPKEIELAIIPGVAFDSKCNRMGRGKGFYDRLLPYVKSLKIGLGYSFQIVDKVPCEEFDIPLDYVVTEKTTYTLL